MSWFISGIAKVDYRRNRDLIHSSHFSCNVRYQSSLPQTFGVRSILLFVRKIQRLEYRPS